MDFVAELRRALLPYRSDETEMRSRWERDEAERYRRLPARAWPAYQPGVDKIPELRAAVDECKGSMDASCEKICFDLATALLFNNIDTKKGLDIYTDLANRGNVDGMTAAGIINVEGLGIESSVETERLGVCWLLKASALGGDQSMYELGTALYTGIDGVLPENEAHAFSFFKRAAAHGHVAAKYMIADCMLTGAGTETNAAAAIPFLFKSAEAGHRFARQRMRELFDLTKE